MTVALDKRALQYACQRVEDFALVNKARPLDEKVDALNIWLEGVGLSDALKRDFADWLRRFLGSDRHDDPAVMIGLAVGLFVNQFNHDNP